MRIVDTVIKFAFEIDTDDGQGYYAVSDELLDEIFELPHISETDSSGAGPLRVVFEYNLDEFTAKCIDESRAALDKCVKDYEKRQAKRRRKKAA